MNIIFRSALIVFLCAAAAGCGGKPKQAAVKGTVTIDGKPLKSGTVIFEMTGARPAVGTIVNGEITEVTTYAPNDGAPIGSHKVAVSGAEEPAAGAAAGANPGDTKGAPKADYMSGKSLLPAAYGDPVTSGLTVEIKPGENTVEFKLLSTGPAK